jgi:hypothetical protein
LKLKWPVILLLICSIDAHAGGFRCGGRIVITGDSVNRLLQTCGKPSVKYKARESVTANGSRKMTGVSNWVYERGRKKNMVVSILSGKVVKIAID